MKILLIEDEPNVVDFVRTGLQEQGFEVVVAYDGSTGLNLALKNTFDVIILDVILPQMNGWEVCKYIREKAINYAPIIMLTALNTTDDVVKGLDIGADDYIGKPFKFKELLARIRALSRRGKTIIENKTLNVADLELDLLKKTVSRGGKEIQLTYREFNLLEYLMKNRNRVVSRIDLLENVWDIHYDLGSNVVDVYVNYLRNKVDKNFSSKLLHTVVGMGYILKEK